MMLTVIIPHYKETTCTVMQAISSISNQVGHSFFVSILVVTDLGGVKLDEKAIRDTTSVPIEFITTDKHEGPGYARQYALNKCNSDYVMFCDADDILASPFVFKYFEDTLQKNPNLQILYTAYLEEFKVNGSFVYTQKDNDTSITTLHGKLYQRKFLVDHNIKFPNWMLGEDGAFNFKAICYAKHVIFDDDVVTYIWKYNINSLTRSNTSLNHLPVNIRSFRDSIKMFESFFDITINNKFSQVNTKVIKPFLNTLEFQLNQIKQIPNLPDEAKGYIRETENKLTIAKEKYKDYL